MFGRIKKIFGMISGCWRTLFLFEIVFRLFSTFLVFPVCKLLFNVCLQVTKIHYLTGENLLHFLSNPLMLICTAVIMLIFSLSTMIEISCLITCLHASRTESPIGIFRLIGRGLTDACRVLHSRNVLLLIVTALLTPVSQLPSSTSPLRLISLPWKSLSSYSLRFPYVLLPISYISVILLLTAYALCTYHVFVLEKCSFRQAITKAAQLNAGARISRAVQFGLFLSILLLTVTVGKAAATHIIASVISLFTDNLTAQYRILFPIDVILGFLKSSIPPIACYCLISLTYYSGKEQRDEPFPVYTFPRQDNVRRQNAMIFYTAAILSALCIILYDAVLRPTLVRYDALEYVAKHPTLIIAHRGYAEDADENTLTAFNHAFDLGADYIEIDVQQTADGVVIVNHDYTFERIFSHPGKVWEMTYDEIRALSSPLTGECPPTLYEVLTLCDPQSNLLIELKNNGHNPSLPEAVYEILAEYDCLERAIIQSPSYRMIHEFKQLAPETQCGYILSFALGQYAQLDSADFFSIDKDFVDESVLKLVHSLGKDLYVWTVNDETRIQELHALGVDGIITDELPLAKAILLTANTSPLDELILEPIEEALSTDAETSTGDTATPCS